MKAESILLERYLNLLEPDAKKEYAEKIWKMLANAYAYAGGYKGAQDINELILDSGIWKLVVRNGEITALRIYKDAFGRKGIATATNGTKQGIKDLHMLTKQDLTMQSSWAEVSDKMEAHMLKIGANPVPNTYVHLLLPGKEITPDEDGYHYFRDIMGEKKRKMIVGFPKIYG